MPPTVYIMCILQVESDTVHPSMFMHTQRRCLCFSLLLRKILKRKLVKYCKKQLCMYIHKPYISGTCEGKSIHIYLKYMKYTNNIWSSFLSTNSGNYKNSALHTQTHIFKLTPSPHKPCISRVPSLPPKTE